MKKVIVYAIIPLLSLLFCSQAFSAGGTGSTCDPSKSGWGTCSLVTIPWAEDVTNTVNVTGGTFSSAYACSAANTKYVLQGNVTANSTAFTISANYVILDLNGYTVTYNQSSAGYGVTITAASPTRNHVAVVNGTITQGAANSDGTNGYGNNPIAAAEGITYGHMANLYLIYSGQDVGGIYLFNGSYCTVEQCTTSDTYSYGLIKNRGQGVDAINLGNTGSSYNTVKYNHVLNAKHRGIRVCRNSDVYENYVTTNSLNTNSYGIGFWLMHDCNIYNNTVIARGAHPIGIGCVGDSGSNPRTSNINIYNNYIDAATTKYCYQYPDYYGNAMWASGIRVGGYEYSLDVITGVKIYDNEIYITTNDSYVGTDTETGAARTITQRAKAFFIGSYTGGDITVANNLVVITGDGPGEAVSPHFPFAEATYFIRNTFVSSDCVVNLSAAYSQSQGYWMFLENNFVLTSNDSDAYTVCTRADPWSDTWSLRYGRFVDNTYSQYASISDNQLKPGTYGEVLLYFGSRSGDTYSYSYNLNDNGGNSGTVITTTYDPPTTLGYSNPTNLSEWGDPPSYTDDATAPVVAITTSDPSNITSDSLAIAGTSSDAVGVTLCRWRLSSPPDNIYGTSLTGTTAWSGTASGFSSGSNTLYVGCRDAANNWGTDSMTVTYTIPNVGCSMVGSPGGLR